MMTAKEVLEITGAALVCGDEYLDRDLQFGFASDLMSDVLRLDVDGLLLVTGLANLQAIRTAEMADIECLIFVRGKKVLPEMKQLAVENRMLLMECPYSMFKTAGLLYANGLKPVF